MSFPRPDLSGLQALNDLAASLRPDADTQSLQDRAEAIKRVQEKIRELEGVGHDDDELIRATYTAADGFSGLTLDPRAMRMPSMDLAAEIVRVSRLARDDFEAKRRELASELGPAQAVDLDEAQANIAKITEQASRSMGDVQAVFEQFRNQMPK